MDAITTTADLRRAGFTSHEVGKMVRDRDLVHLRRGAYVTAPGPQQVRADGSRADEALAQHRLLVRATLPLLAPDAAASHRSAAVLHQIALLSAPPARVEVTRPSVRGGKNRGGVHLHASPLTEDETTLVDGLLVTTVSRTVLDLARILPFSDAVVAGDSALREGLAPPELETALAAAGRRPGVAAARRALAALDGRSESPGESLSRLALLRAGLPTPTPQLVVVDDRGRELARCDFGWPERRTIGEFDGKVKYGRLVRAGENPGEVMYREKLREDTLRDAGWQVVRWTWADLARFEVVVARLQRAFARAGCPL